MFHKQDNLSRGNLGAVKVLQGLFPEAGRLQFIYADLGDAKAVIIHIPKILWSVFFFLVFCMKYEVLFIQVDKIFSENAFDAVMHFAAVAYVGESTLDPLKYNI